jgi:hypothetical protein
MKTGIIIALLSLLFVQATGVTAYGQPHHPPSKSASFVSDDTLTDQIRLKLASDPVRALLLEELKHPGAILVPRTSPSSHPPKLIETVEPESERVRTESW